MMDIKKPPPLTPEQIALVERPVDVRVFLQGPAGAGKTTVGVERTLHLMDSGVPADSILLFFPQRTQAAPYLEALRHPGVTAGGTVAVVTLGGLARRMVDLYWPLVAEEAGFAWPHRPPTFLTLETAQYHMANVVRPLLGEGFFETLVIDRNRLYSQIIDNLNKAAMVGFPHQEIGERLRSASIGDPVQARVYEDAQVCASRFRAYCLDHNLLDFSLQVVVFLNQLWPYPICREYLLETYRHLIVDNVEENPPVAHDLLEGWLPACESSLVIYDTEGGYRVFLGADPQTGHALHGLCDETHVLEDSFVTSPEMETLGAWLTHTIGQQSAEGAFQVPDGSPPEAPSPFRPPLYYSREPIRYFPAMLDWVADRIAWLVHEDDVPPEEIVVLAPFLSDALRFSLTDRLTRREVPVRSHRPSRALREEPVTQCLLTLAAVAHPGWSDPETWIASGGARVTPSRFDLAYALLQAIAGMDLVRAQLLSDIVYRVREGKPDLAPFEQIVPDTQERITFRLGERYDRLRNWIASYSQGEAEELDPFLRRLFGEVLSQPGFGFHRNTQAGEITANLIESIQKFRWVAGERLEEEGIPLGLEYLTMVKEGVIAAQYIRSWDLEDEGAVLLAPAYTFLMRDRPVDFQFWLDVGGNGWYERIYQPLTHPYVLSRHWPKGQTWTDENEFAASQVNLQRLILGLVRRCRRGVYLGLSELSEQGYESRGRLLRAIDRALQGYSSSKEGGDV
jgi:hypothetical protein